MTVTWLDLMKVHMTFVRLTDDSHSSGEEEKAQEFLNTVTRIEREMEDRYPAIYKNWKYWKRRPLRDLD